MAQELPKVIRRRTQAEENMLLRRYVAVSLIGLFIFNSMCTMSCIFLIGFGVMNLSNMVIHYLMTQTIGQGAAIVLLVARNLFPVKGFFGFCPKSPWRTAAPASAFGQETLGAKPRTKGIALTP